MVVLALFAYQTTASALNARGGSGFDRAQSGSASMVHEQSSSTQGQTPCVPVPGRSSDCDHSLPYSCCNGSVVAIVGVPILTDAPSVIQPLFGLAPTNGPLSVDLAPDVPPPRA